MYSELERRTAGQIQAGDVDRNTSVSKGAQEFVVEARMETGDVGVEDVGDDVAGVD